MQPKTKMPWRLLVIALVAVFAFSALAQLFNTAFYKVDVSRIAFEGSKGTLSGLLYMPKGASDKDPRPTVVVTHGYLNSAEMQDANAIELSRRGYVVLALDMYDHGHSKATAENTGNFMHFWPTALFDAVSYIYQQPYVLKDAEKNGIIGVTGHSMGGFSSSMAVFMDEQAAATNGYRMIKAGLSEGSDYSMSGFMGVTAEVAAQNGGGRTLGQLAAQFDEFFFNADDYKDTDGSVRKKNYVATTQGKTFLEQEAPEADTWYDTKDGGKRIVYQPYETHPWNHFSAKSTAHAVDFYNTAFADYSAAFKPAEVKGQIWFYKELFELFALVAFVLTLVPLAMLVLRLPFFNKAVTGVPTPVKSVTTTSGKIAAFALLLFVILLPAILFPAIMDKQLKSAPMLYLRDAGIIGAVIGLAAMVLGTRDSDNKKKFIAGGAVLLVAGAALTLLTVLPTFEVSKTWPAPTSNQIGYWALVSALISSLVLGLGFVVSKARQGADCATYGLKASPVAILAALATGLVVSLLGYGLVFLVDLLFKTDFRFWVFAFKAFGPELLPAMLRYLPVYFLYYLVSAVAIFVNTNTDKLKGKRGYVLASLLNAGGIALFVVYQYGMLFMTGVAPHPTQALTGILLFALVPTLVIAACITRALYKRTGNVWTAAFLNAILMTMMTLANTTVFFR